MHMNWCCSQYSATIHKTSETIRTQNEMHKNPVTEAKIIAGPPGTTLRNRETTVEREGRGDSKT